MPKKAAALQYDKATQATPKVVAKGKGEVAQKIIQKAEEFDIPLFANEALVNSLIDLELDQEIPPELYQAVVEVFVWIMKNEKKAQI
jgi:flagellar biosynthesis protein